MFCKYIPFLALLILLAGCTGIQQPKICGDGVCDTGTPNPEDTQLSPNYCPKDCRTEQQPTRGVQPQSRIAKQGIEQPATEKTFEAKTLEALRTTSGIEIKEKETGKKLLEVEALDNKSLDTGQIQYKTNSGNEERGYSVVSGLNLTGGQTKTLYIERKNLNSSSVCFSDTEGLDTKEDVLKKCITIQCPGKLGNYSCTIEDNQYAISGLTHSGAVEVIPTIPPPIPRNENALCIYNSNSERSKAICDYYASKRPGVNSLGLNIPDSAFLLDPLGTPQPGRNRKEDMSSDNFFIYVLRPVKQYVNSNPQLKITHIAVAKDVPARAKEIVLGTEVYISGSALLSIEADWDKGNSMTEIHNYYGGNYNTFDKTYSKKSIHFDPDNYRKGNYRWGYRYAVSYLTGYTLEDIKKMIDKAVASPPNLSTAKWVIDRDEDEFSVSEAELRFAQAALMYRGVPQENILLERTNNKPINIQGDVVAYGGPGTWHTNYNGGWIANDPIAPAPVANRAIFTSYESINAANFSDGPSPSSQYQGLITDAFAPNAFGGTNYSRSFAGAVGTVAEPGGGGVTLMDELFSAYASGLTFGESHLSTLKHRLERYSGFTTNFSKNIAIGDPLMRVTDSQQNLVPNGTQCSGDADCYSGNCDADNTGVKVCHPTQNGCPTNMNPQYTGIAASVYAEAQSGNSICTEGKRKTLQCIDSQWQAPQECQANSECTERPSDVTLLFAKPAGCKLSQATACNANEDCASGSCNADIKGVKRCRNQQPSCILDEGGYETQNGLFACVDDNKRAQCSNGSWGQSETCANGCINGACNDASAGSTLTLKANVRHYLTLTVSPPSRRLNDLFPSAGDGSQIFLVTKSGNANRTLSYAYDDLDNSWIPENAEISLGQGFVFKPARDYQLTFNGNPFTAPVPANVYNSSSLIGIPFCPDRYKAADVAEEMRKLNSKCTAVFLGDTGNEASSWWSWNLKYSSKGRRVDFPVRRHEAFWVVCEDGVNFTWTPSCPAAGTVRPKTFALNDVSITQDNTTTSFRLENEEVLSMEFSGDPIAFKDISVKKEPSIVRKSGGPEKSYVIVRNLPGSITQSKKVAIKKTFDASNAVCVSERDNLNSAEEISANCIQVKCPGVTGNYTCSIEGSGFAVLGPKPFGVIEHTIEPPPNSPPTVSVSSPSNNSAFTSPARISLAATASDNDGAVSKVEFYNGSTLLGSDSSAPYTFTWENVPAGEYSVTAKATDDKGASTTSNPVKLTVNPPPNKPPTIGISSPANNSTFTAPATINLRATASDSDGTVARTEFYNGESLLATDSSAPYNYTWENVAVGEYAITARAIDDRDSSSASAPVKIIVNAPHVPPAKPVVEIKTEKGLVTENSQDEMVFTISRTGTASSQLVVKYSIGGTAIKGTDYTGLPDSAMITAGNSSTTIKATPIDDQIVEIAESITVALSEDSTYAVGNQKTAAAAILDNDFSTATNNPPAVRILSPANNTESTAPATINMSAEALDSDGTVSKVEFYQNDILLTTLNSAPFTYNWGSVSAGNYSLKAVAYDDKGATTTSERINVKVSPPLERKSVLRQTDLKAEDEAEGSVVRDKGNNKKLLKLRNVGKDDTRLQSIEYKRNAATETKGYTIIKGLQLKENETKTVYVEKKDTSSNGVCVNDTETVSVKEDITGNCTRIKCPGAGGSYSCDIEESSLVVSGLRHSGIIEATIQETPPAQTTQNPPTPQQPQPPAPQAPASTPSTQQPPSSGPGGGTTAGGSSPFLLKASISSAKVEPQEAGKASVISATLRNSGVNAQAFWLEAQITKDTKEVFTSIEQVSGLRKGSTQEFAFKKKWIPSESGEYIVTLTLRSSNKSVKYDAQKEAFTVKRRTTPKEQANTNAQKEDKNRATQQDKNKETKAGEEPKEQAAKVDLEGILVGTGIAVVLIAAIAFILSALKSKGEREPENENPNT